MSTERFRLHHFVLLALLAAAIVVPLFGQPYYTKLVARIVIFGLAAMSLDLVVGYAGLVSLGHAAYFGLGCYVAGTLPMAGVQGVFLVLPLAAVAAGLLGLVTGAVSLRASGLYFIFITLAFAQMAYYVAAGMRPLGGLDGFRLPAPTLLPGGLALNQPAVLLWFCLALLLAALWLGDRIVRSPFGHVLRAARDNRLKLAAVGLPAYPAQLAMYALSAALAGIAGACYANLTEFVAPASMSVFVSAEFLFMVILGGAGTLAGPVIGALAFVVLEQLLSAWSEHWMFWLGVLLVLRVLFLHRGLYGVIRR
ncbi:MAG: transporter permease [Ramlibacter sp.]|nr:transporter permease [Ramlibacter sp.]